MYRALALLLFVSLPVAAHAQAAGDAPNGTTAPVVGEAANNSPAATTGKVRRDRKGRLCTNNGMWSTSSDVNNSPSASDLNSGDDWHSGGASDASGSFQD